MTKIAFWTCVLAFICTIADWHDRFSKKCEQAGGLPTLTVVHYVCLHPSATIDLKE